MNRLTAAGAALLAVATLAACGSSDNSSGSGASAAGSTDASSGSSDGASGSSGIRVAYVSPTGAQIGQQQINMGLTRAAKEANWSSSVIDSALSPDRQVSNVDTLINEKVSAFASWTLDPGATTGAYTRAQSAGIPVIGVNSTGDGLAGTVWWQVDVCKPGYPFDQQAQYIARARPGASVIVMGGPPVPSIQAYVRCFTTAATRAGLRVINETDNTRDDSASAAQLASDLLTKNPDVDVFWAYNDATALGISSAILNNGKSVSDGTSDGIMDFGVNGDPDAIQAVREGRLTGTWDTDSVGTGWAMALGMREAMARRGQRIPDLVVRSTLWTRANIGQYVDPDRRDYTFDTIPLVR
ncbi:MAG TPA: sugar ABC transporter substrate-binding protein [Conexibacter sp.]